MGGDCKAMDGTAQGIIGKYKDISKTITEEERWNIWDWYLRQGFRTNQPINWFIDLYRNVEDRSKDEFFACWWGQQKAYGRHEIHHKEYISGDPKYHEKT